MGVHACSVNYVPSILERQTTCTSQKTHNNVAACSAFYGALILLTLLTECKKNTQTVRLLSLIVKNEMNRALGHLCAHIG